MELALRNLGREGVQEVNELKGRVLNGHGCLTNDKMQRPLGFLQEGVKPHLHVTLSCDWAVQLHCFSLTG